jgi:hypothetical protein
MSCNSSAKNKLIQLYGAECFIEKLHLRKDTNRHYTSNDQMKKMKQLTYHHIVEKSKGGKATIENGAILSAENHEWFNKQSEEAQAQMNKMFQEYKKCKVQLVDDLDTEIEIKAMTFEIPLEKEKPKEKFNRAKEKREFRKIVEEEMEL